MTSFLKSFLDSFGTRSARTLTAPNSWAVVSLWRRFFLLKEQEQEEQLDLVIQALEEEYGDRQVCPIVSQEAASFRQEFMRQCRERDMERNRMTVAAAQAAQQMQMHQEQMRARAEEQVNRPNLQIPVADNESMYLAQ